MKSPPHQVPKLVPPRAAKRRRLTIAPIGGRPVACPTRQSLRPSLFGSRPTQDRRPARRYISQGPLDIAVQKAKHSFVTRHDSPCHQRQTVRALAGRHTCAAAVARSHTDYCLAPVRADQAQGSDPRPGHRCVDSCHATPLKDPPPGPAGARAEQTAHLDRAFARAIGQMDCNSHANELPVSHRSKTEVGQPHPYEKNTTRPTWLARHTRSQQQEPAAHK